MGKFTSLVPMHADCMLIDCNRFSALQVKALKVLLLELAYPRGLSNPDLPKITVMDPGPPTLSARQEPHGSIRISFPPEAQHNAHRVLSRAALSDG